MEGLLGQVSDAPRGGVDFEGNALSVRVCPVLTADGRVVQVGLDRVQSVQFTDPLVRADMGEALARDFASNATNTTFVRRAAAPPPPGPRAPA